MAIPSYEDLMLPVLRLCATGELTMRDLISTITTETGLPSDEAATQVPSGTGMTVIASRTGWAKTYLKQAGLLTQPRRGVVTITKRGRDLLAERPDRISSDSLLRYPEFQAFKVRSRASATDDKPSGVVAAPGPAATPEERIAQAMAEIEAELRSKLLDAVRAASPTFFEGLIVDLMLAMDYGGSRADAGERLGQSGDGGVDGVIREDRLGLDRIYLQAKKYEQGAAVGRPAMQAFVGALHGQGAHKGVFITTSGFTKEAREYAANLGNMRVVLIEGETLARLMLQYGVGVRTRDTIVIKRLDVSYFGFDEDADAD